MTDDALIDVVKGQNIQDFLATQLMFTRHVRNPDSSPRPPDVEPRRMQIYLDLIYNNVENFIASTFPVAKSCLDDERWQALIREFLSDHGATSPYFLEVSEEFLAFLSARGLHNLPGFLLELCHYEWVEMALDVSSESVSDAEFDRPILEDACVSPLAEHLVYSYPVHEIGPANQPQTPAEVPSFLIVYRDRHDAVRFMVSNAMTYRLLEVFQQESNLAQAAATLADELTAAGREISASDVLGQVRNLVEDLHARGILLAV